MKVLVLGIFLLITNSAMAGIEDEIENATKRLASPKSGRGDHTVNGVTVISGETCSVALKYAGGQHTVAESFEITVDGKTMGVDIEGWDAFGEELEADQGHQAYEMQFEDRNGCIYTWGLTFEPVSISFSEAVQCPSAYRVKSESMRCDY